MSRTRYYWTGSQKQAITYRVVSDAASTPTKVALIGDSLSDQEGQGEVNVVSSLHAVGWPNLGISFYAWPGKEIADSDPGGHTTVWNIQQVRASFGEPDVWIFPLGTNSAGDTSQKIAADLQTVFSELGPDARVLWVNCGISYAEHPGILNCNALIADAVNSRPKTGLADWYVYVNSIDQSGIWTDGTHMTPAGYALRNEFIAQASISVLTTV